MSSYAVFLFIGDLLVMAFLCVLAAWLLWVAPKEDIERTMRLPLLEDDEAADTRDGDSA